MLFKRTIIAVALAAALCQPAAAAPQPLEIEPSSPWTLKYNPERCNLMREFGSGSSKVHLEIISFGSWTGFEVLLTGPAIHKTESISGTVKVRLAGDPEESKAATFQGTAGQYGAMLFGLRFVPFQDRAAFDKLSDEDQALHETELWTPAPDYDATVDSISVHQSRGGVLELKTGNMAKPLAALRTCVDALNKSWGADPSVQKTLSRSAKPKEATVMDVQANFPEKMADNGINGYVPVRVAMDAAGNASNCTIQLENVQADFAQAACKNLTGKFDHALDKQGHPVQSIYETNVIYQIAE